jgi:uncharacterized coiled-coil protein SlyX
VAAVACAWAWQLQQQLDRAGSEMESYARRIGDLEARLSDTDEGMSQNAAVQAAKIRELDTEVRKLWDNVWKKAKERLAKLEASSASQGKKIAAMEKSVASAQSQLKGATGDIAKLKSVAGDLERLMASAKANQSEVERQNQPRPGQAQQARTGQRGVGGLDQCLSQAGQCQPGGLAEHHPQHAGTPGSLIVPAAIVCPGVYNTALFQDSPLQGPGS